MTLLALRSVLALVLGVAAIGKVRDRRGTVEAARQLGVPPRLAPLTAAALPVAEGVTAALLLAAGTARAGALAALVLLGGFTVAMGRTLAAGRRPSCHCFGQLGDAPIGAASLARNALLAFLAAGVLAGGSDAEASPATAVGDAGGGSAVNVLVAFLLLIVLRVGSAPRV